MFVFCMANIPKHELEALARLLLPQIQAFYDSEEGQKMYEEYKKKEAESNITADESKQ